jgi:hypothetical protein
MYNLVPIVSTETIYNAFLKVHYEDSKDIINRLDELIEGTDIKITYKQNVDEVKFLISTTNNKFLELFYFKISILANDSYIRRTKKN